MKRTRPMTEFSMDLHGVPIEVEADVIYESNYGADADGNRGIPAYFVEETIVKVSDVDITELISQKDMEVIDERAIEEYQRNERE